MFCVFFLLAIVIIIVVVVVAITLAVVDPATLQQTARKSTGGKAPRKQLAAKSQARKTAAVSHSALRCLRARTHTQFEHRRQLVA